MFSEANTRVKQATQTALQQSIPLTFTTCGDTPPTSLAIMPPLRSSHTLAVSVCDAWENLPSDTILRVFNRIPVVLQLIVDHNGENDLVETRRGLIPPPEE
jgi:hypothetical protein